MAKVKKKVANLRFTARMEKFCQEYLIDLNATQAAIRAKYSKKTANRMASENLSKPVIQARIKELQEELQKKTGIDVVELTNRFDRLSKKAEESKNLSEARQNNIEIAKHIGYYEKDNQQKQAIINIS